jgi:uncharacterized protein YukE
VAQANVNPDELDRFASNLTTFNGQLRDSMGRLKGQFNGLGDTWRDDEQRKFAEEFVQTMRVLDRFLKVADDHIPFLHRKAAAGRKYLQQT